MHNSHIKESVRWAMKETSKNTCWWLNPAVESVLRYAESEGWLTRMSVTQVYWNDVKMGGE